MFKRKITNLNSAAPCAISIFFLLAILIGQAHAATFTAYGPKIFQRSSGQSVTETVSFSVPNANASFTLKVYNGGLEDGEITGELVSSGEIRLNGVLIVGPQNFNQNVNVTSEPVTLQTSNNLSVELRGKPGGLLVIEIVGIDNDPSIITVPSIVGMLQATAESTLIAANLIVGAITTANSSTIPSGNVISQNPVAGTTVSSGSSVDLAVSLGPLMIAVPNVVGMAQPTAESTIISGNLAVGAIIAETSNTVPAGDVISQNPIGGTSVVEGSFVDLVISLGSAIATVPDVVSMEQATAESTIMAANLVVGTITTANSATVPSGNVINQNPVAGIAVSIGSSVDLVVSLGPLMIAVPNVVGMAQPTAESTIISGNLVVGAITSAFSSTVPAGFVLDQNPIAGTSAAEGTSVDLMVSLGPDTGTIPPDPASVAPQLDPTVATTMVSATEFLYTGNNPIQTGVTPGTIEPTRVVVLRGKVMEGDGITPISGVTITILNHPEYGRTLSRQDGMFDMAVNGGGLLTLDYFKTGYIPIQRQVKTPWQDYVRVEDVVMIPYDTQVTTIDLTANVPIQTAQGSQVTDTDGTRQATILFPQGTTANMIFPDGTTQPLTNLNVRATEYTVGPNGPDAMPAPLPPNSGYTYAVELSIDEAVAAGAKEVTFNQPVINYVENFLGFPVGGIVPSGFYDREKAAWIPSNNGLVIEILNINANALAEIDIDGSGLPADQASLDALGITNSEQKQLAVLYMTGQSLWRVPITHFTPWDYNWPFAPPEDAEDPKQPEAKKDDKEDDPCEKKGSILECQNQVLKESLNITGTPFTLNYSSDRVPGRTVSNTLNIQLSGSSVPVSLQSIELKVDVAGSQFNQSFLAVPNQRYTFVLDGQDGYGRTLQGNQKVTVEIGYVYGGVYQEAERFGSNGNGIPITGNKTRQEVTLWQKYTTIIGSWDARAQGLGGWSLNPHHAYDPTRRALYLGNGKRSSSQNINSIITTVVNNSATFGITAGPDGSVYIGESLDNRIRSVSPDGIITIVAGTGGEGYSGDGGPAINAKLFNPSGLAVDKDGSLYIADLNNDRIRRVSPDGIITTVAGNGTRGFSGDGGLATDAQLFQPRDVAVGSDGSLYIADFSNHRIRKVGADGIINTVAGNGSSGYSGDGGFATNAQLNFPKGVAVDSDGSLYIADTFNHRIRRVSPDGFITTVAGNGTGGYYGDGDFATVAQLFRPRSVTLGPDGSLYIADALNNRIRRVGPDGFITTVAGNGTGGYNGDGGLVTNAQLLIPSGVAFGLNDSMFIADSINKRIRKVTSPLPGFSGLEFLIVSQDGSELHNFNPVGKHISTLNTLTQTVKYNFIYDSQGLLSQVQDGDGNITTIERDINGNPAAIIAPDGQRTELTLDSNGYLGSITDPETNTTQFTYTANGLMSTMIDPNTNTYNFTYGTLGRLIKDENPAGGFWALTRTDSNTDDSYTVDVSSAMGRTTRYLVDRLTTGDLFRSNTNPNGFVTETIIGTDGSTEITSTDGMVTTIQQGPDPRWGMQAPLTKNMTITTPGGIISTLTSDRTVSLIDPNDPLTLSAQTDTTIINSRTFTSVFDSATKNILSTTPTGRQTTSTIDSQGRVRDEQITGLDPLNYTYDLRGRLTKITQGSGVNDRISTITYNNEGFVGSITDPLLRTLSFVYDLKGQVTKQILPDLREINYSYDANGNVTSITPPGRPDHNFTYTSVNLEQEYIPPFPDPLNLTPDPRTAYTYNLDKQLTLITRPDTQTASFSYDTGGRLNALIIPRGQVSYAYSPTTGNLSTITAPDAGTISFTYDGSLLLNSSWTGVVAGSISRTYDNNFWITSRSINGGNIINFNYDNDGLLTQAGNITLIRNAQNGLPTGTTLGNVTDTIGYNSFGEMDSYSASISAVETFATQFTRDKLGRITQKVENVSGQTHTYDYSYDLGGRLTDVTKDGTFNVQYQYDDNGNRISRTTPGPLTTTGVTDNQDRLTSYGDYTYTYTDNGELLSKTDTSTNETTTYNYDVLGNLMSVILPDATLIEYIIDGNNRRMGKKVNGVLVQGFLYKDQLNPIADLDGAGNVVSRFVYGSKFNVPDYMVTGGITYRIISDHLGSPRIVVDTTTGQVVQQVEYDEFGNIVTDTNPGFQPFGFAGGIYDQNTGLTKFGSRDYDAYTGRWTTKDPIRFNGGDTNLYGYVLQDPINFIDPWGLKKKSFINRAGQFLRDFIMGAADALFILPPSVANPDAMIGLKRLLDKQQENYEEWGRITGEWGNENPYRTPLTKVPDDVLGPKDEKCKVP